MVASIVNLAWLKGQTSHFEEFGDLLDVWTAVKTLLVNSDDFVRIDLFLPVSFVLKGRTVDIGHFRGLSSHVNDVNALIKIFPGTWFSRNAILI